jgi:transcriptional regulator with XRE-family HTH domain
MVRGRRRVPGLRREEVAVLAGVSVEYYTRLEQGNARGASEEVLYSVAKALRMDETERGHLFDLVRALGPAARRSRPPGRQPARPQLATLLEAMTGAAAILLNERGDVLGANALGRALYQEMFRLPEPISMPRFVFLDPSARTFHRDWDEVADIVVSLLRAQSLRPRSVRPGR